MPKGEPIFEQQKLPVDVSYEQLEARIPEVAKMKGFDQRSDFHTLTLDEHTKQLGRNLENNLDSLEKWLKDQKKKEDLEKLEQYKDLILLAGKLHDLGKVSEEGMQVHPKDPEKRQYVGHEKESEKIVREVVPKHFNLKEEELDLVAKLAGLHASALNLVGNFQSNNQPKGKGLKSYDQFFKKAEALPMDVNIETKMRIVFALNKSDKGAGWNEQSDPEDPKVKTVQDKAEKQIKTLEEMEKALPALVAAIEGRRAGDQKAGIVLEKGEYVYKAPEKKEKKKVEIPPGLKKLSPILRDKVPAVAEVYPTLQAKKGNERALQGIINGLLKKKIGLTDEQIEAVLKTLE